MASVQVFGCPTWPEVARVLACLFEKDVKFQLIRPNNYDGLKRMPSLKEKGPQFAFKDGKVTLQESREICRHIAEKYVDQGTKDLLAVRGTNESSELVLNLGFALPTGPDKEVIEQNKQKLDEVLHIYEKRLQETEFLAGDKFTLADLSHLPNVQRLVSNDEYNSLITSRKKLSLWWDVISRRQSWQRVVEMQQQLPSVK
ncbi:glutathione S-transferase F10 [Cocos nucifera]|nr:glutathione S-transferase F10 [Cocos nucifera]